MSIKKTRSFRASMTIINTNIGSRRRSKYLTLIFKRWISLNNSHRKITRCMRLQICMPQKSITTPPSKTPLQRPITQSHHNFSVQLQFLNPKFLWERRRRRRIGKKREMEQERDFSWGESRGGETAYWKRQTRNNHSLPFTRLSPLITKPVAQYNTKSQIMLYPFRAMSYPSNFDYPLLFLSLPTLNNFNSILFHVFDLNIIFLKK